MARPALLIGLGGTGQWVLTYVKKELLEYTKGEGVPEEVRMVAFDTARPIEEKKKPDEEEPIVVDGVRLGIGEFYHLGGNIEKTVREIVDEKRHPHVASWLQARTYLTRLGPGQYVLEEGAGQMRPFGRMAVFKDLEANPEESRIFGTLQDCITGIREKVKEDRNLEISIITSLAGGTGAGMAIDIAHLARTIAEKTLTGSQKFVIRGFFVLPRAFHRIPGGDNQDMRARAFAAIRELSRFLTVFGDRKYPMVYNEQPAFREYMQQPVTKRLFDLCYLIDAQRARNSLDGVEAKYGVFPTIADALLAFLDERSGQAHTEHVKNVTRDLVRPDPERGIDTAFFSSLGTYSFALPIRDIAEESACNLAIDFLNKLTRPEFNDAGEPIRLSAADNQEMRGKRGRDLGDGFLENPGSVEDIRGTLFLPEVARTVESGHVRNETLIKQNANRSSLDWLRVIEPDEITDELRDLRYKVREVLEHRLRQTVKSSRQRKLKPEADLERVERDVNQYRNEYLGREVAGGKTSGGKFREALEQYEEMQTQRFRQGLGEYVVSLLNGTTETDPEVSRSAKLGFVLEFLERVAERLDTYCQFLDRVRATRAEEGRLQLQREQVQAARAQMFEDRKKTGLLSKAGYNAQEEFLDLMEQQIELEKDEMVFETVQHIARQLRDRSIALRDLLKDWAAALALGSAERVSLHAALQRARVQVRARRAQADHFSRVRKEETDEEYERSLYERFAHQQLEAMFRRLEWRLADEGDVTLSLYGSPLMRVRRQERDRPTEENLKLLLGGTRRAFQSLVETESISKRLLPRYPPDALGRELHDNGSPLYSEKSAPPFARTANFLTVRYGETEGDEPYFRQVIGTLQGLTGAKGQAAQLVTSEGYHKCTLVYTKDILNADSMTTYDDLYNAYRSYADDRRLLHNFPAEVNAVYYEQRLQEKLRQTYRTFSPRIVFMLEHREWVRQFVRCLVHRLVDVQQDEERKPFWAADLPECEFKNRRFNHELIELGDHVTSGQPDLFQAMDTFVFLQKDYRQGWEVPLQEDHLVAALVQAENRVGDDGANVQALRGFIDGELIQELKRSQKEYERDLGDLMHLVLLDEIDRLSIRRTA